jgi:hypothetical protein
MAKTVKAPEKKAAPAKTVAQKVPARRNIRKGQSLACEVCGLSVSVDEIGGVPVSEETILLCCGKPMREKVAAKKVAKK